MKYKILYAVINEGDVVYASENEESAKAQVDNQYIKARENILNEWGNDDPTCEDIEEADFQADYNGEHYSVEMFDVSNLTEDDTVVGNKGTEIDVLDLLRKVEKCLI